MAEEKKLIRPDFLMIPDIVNRDSKLQPADKFLYGAIYWFEHLKDGECTAGNPVLAWIACISPSAVGNGLTRLEKAKYIVRTYRDPIKKQDRLNIRALVAFRQEAPSSNREGYPPQMRNRRRIYKDMQNRRQVFKKPLRTGAGELKGVGELLKGRLSK